jgi:prepilin-type N-terminal cleavage/methylation domain-containing protein
MKTTRQQPSAVRAIRAVTLPEMMISMMVFGLLLMGLISVNLFGLRQDELVNAKLGANDSSRTAFDLMLNEIRGGKGVQIGTGWHTNFVAITNGPQQGDTLQIAPSTNTSAFIYYYIDTNSADLNYQCLVRISTTNNGVTTNYTTNIICTYLTNMPSQWATNALMFQAYDYTGTNLMTVDPSSVSNYNYVVSFLLQFSQFQYPQTKVGSNYFFNYYQIQFQASRRSPTI